MNDNYGKPRSRWSGKRALKRVPRNPAHKMRNGIGEKGAAEKVRHIMIPTHLIGPPLNRHFPFDPRPSRAIPSPTGNSMLAPSRPECKRK